VSGQELADPERPTMRRRVAHWWSGDSVQPPTPRIRARQRAIRRAVIGSAVLIIAGSFVRLPLLVTTPGPTFNTLGKVDGEPMVSISGTTTYPTSGALEMTTVSERGGSSGGVALGEAIAGWFAPRASVIPREVYYDPNESGAEVTEHNDQAFATSQSDAIAAALRQLGIRTVDSVVVTLVGGGTPADGVVAAGDLIVAVDGTKVSTPDEVVAAVRAATVGQTIEIDVLRADDSGKRTAKKLQVTTDANPSTDPAAAGTPWIGIAVGTLYEAPFDIDFAAAGVGGPSAGMMFSLAIYDMLTPGPITGGGAVAGTGTIDAAGTVGPIGFIDKKLLGARSSGATLFLAPAGNCTEVVGHIPDGLTVVPVGDLEQAVDAVEKWSADKDATLPTCQQTLDQESSSS
jgi:Lon-like protease